MRFPLYHKIVLWFFLNLMLVALAFYVVFQVQFRTGIDSFLMAQAGQRVQTAADLISSELSGIAPTEWNSVLKRFSLAYDVKFALIGPLGTLLAGQVPSFPPEVSRRLTTSNRGRGPPPGGGSIGTGGAGGAGRLMTRERSGAQFMIRSHNPNGYWIGVPVQVQPPNQSFASNLTLLITTASILNGGLFFDVRPWILLAAGVCVLSVLFWFPLVRGITRSISLINLTSLKIAQGNFDNRLELRRRDELGQLSATINRMAGQLAAQVNGHKRFLADVAHELCAPLSRIQVALGILEERAQDLKPPELADLREELEIMAKLVNELLSFTKAGLIQTPAKLEAVALATVLHDVLCREAISSKQAALSVSDDIQVVADKQLLGRAIANVARNALRYAGGSGPITISAHAQNDRVDLIVADSGPGVPEQSLHQIFDPFFRIDSSRSRETGGTGLGLTIAKNCIECCQGTIQARNRLPTGLEILINLKRA